MWVIERLINRLHRNRSQKTNRDSNEINEIWKDYEKLLFKLIGNYLNRIKRIDRILKIGVIVKCCVLWLCSMLNSINEFNTFKYKRDKIKSPKPLPIIFSGLY